MRRTVEIISCIVYIVLVCMAMASCVVVVASCSENETNRAAPNMISHDRHVKAAATQPSLAPLVEIEAVAVHEYYAAIASGDQKRFVAAKADLAAAVKATDKSMGGGK